MATTTTSTVWPLDLWCPFPSAVNPYAERADRESFAWMAGYGLVPEPSKAERLRRQRSGELAARTNPEVDGQMLRLLSDWYVWLFAFDDGYCEDNEQGGLPGPVALTTAMLARALDSDLSVAGAAGPYAVALRDVRDRVGVYASGLQLARWESTVHDYLAAQVWEAANRQARRFPELDEYVAMRRHAGATYTCLTLIDIAARQELPPHEAASPALRGLTDVTANLVSWDNDLYSYAKEKASDHGRHNLVAVLAHHHRCPPDRARELAVVMRDQEMDRFVTACSSLDAGTSPQTRPYARSLGLWLRGHIEWNRTSSRFDVSQDTPSRDIADSQPVDCGDPP